MSIPVKAATEEKKQEDIQLRSLPDKCPRCGKHGQPDLQLAALNIGQRIADVVFRCPIDGCRALYIGKYRVARQGVNANSSSLQTSVLAVATNKVTFAETIETLSPLFSTTYNQALIAQENNLDQICGPGYRKALEFLIKDFLISYVYKENSPKQEEVKKLFLGKAIEDHVTEEKIKRFAQRAVWIGNDETHYTRKWENKDIEDLKALVRITVDYIDLTIESDRYLADMPDPKK